MTKERVTIFIDGSNLYYSLKNLKIDRIDFQKLLQLLAKDKMLISTFYYNAPLNIQVNPKTYWEQQKFFNELRKIPDFNVVLCKLRKHKRKNGNYVFDVKGDDVHLTVDLVSGAYENLYDSAIIVSGDEDFVPAIKKVQKLGKKIINAYFKSSSSASLKKTCDDFIYMNDLVKDL
ncbi:MAG: NYN domain-containing protein [Nanoarchaeota archaeon]|nr:NYN domain-containing protein [Nanoarchaeota archaeon]